MIVESFSTMQRIGTVLKRSTCHQGMLRSVTRRGDPYTPEARGHRITDLVCESH